jgi:hypothetical protein
MFKIGDIIKLEHNFKNVILPSELKDVKQSYIVLKYDEPIIEIKGLKNNIILTVWNGYFKLDLQLIRKQKLNKICSKLGI